eukprot:gene24408-29507_t
MSPLICLILCLLFSFALCQVHHSHSPHHLDLNGTIPSYASTISDLDLNSHAFFAATPLQLFLQISAEMRHHEDSPYHRPENLQLILNTVNFTGVKLSEHRRHAGRSFESHGIGTASCGLRVGLSPVAVAGLIAHGLYTNRWDDDEWDYSWSLCKLRNIVTYAIGAEAEKYLLMFTALTAHGPDATIFHGLAEEMRKNFTKFDNPFDRDMILMLLCDEIEEHVAGVQWFTRNWKHRNATFYEDALFMARAYRNDHMVMLLERGFAVTQEVFPTDNRPVPARNSEKSSGMLHIVQYFGDMMVQANYPEKDTKFERIDALWDLVMQYRKKRAVIAPLWHDIYELFNAHACSSSDSSLTEAQLKTINRRFRAGFDRLKEKLRQLK